MKTGKIILMIVLTGCAVTAQDNRSEEMGFRAQRIKMVRQQIERRGVTDERVLDAMRKVPRHKFIPENLWNYAYYDEPLPIGEDQTISQPYIVAYMTEKLELKKTDKVLEIGTGSGYQAAVLAEIVDSVFTIEIVEPLARRAEKKLKQLKYDNVFCKTGDGYAGWPEHAPFDAIILTAAPPVIPEPLTEQLAAGGRMILPLGQASQDLVLVRKTKDGITTKELLAVRFVPMTGEVLKKH